MPGILHYLTNPKVFAALGIVFALAIVFSLLNGFFRSSRSTPGTIHQAGELEDKPPTEVPADVAGTPQPAAALTPTVKRYDSAPSLTIDAGRTYVATIKTSKGDIQIQLDPKAAPEAVNSFLFLAKEGYYNNTPFMQLVTNQDGSRFVAQAGDPTRTGLGSPGYSIKKESTSAPFARGAVGMGGSSPTSNGGQFFISYGDYPALKDKYTIFGSVLSGMDVVDKINLLDLTKRDAGASGDTIISVEIRES